MASASVSGVGSLASSQGPGVIHKATTVICAFAAPLLGVLAHICPCGPAHHGGARTAPAAAASAVAVAPAPADDGCGCCAEAAQVASEAPEVESCCVPILPDTPGPGVGAAADGCSCPTLDLSDVQVTSPSSQTTDQLPSLDPHSVVPDLLVGTLPSAVHLSGWEAWRPPPDPGIRRHLLLHVLRC